MIKDFDYNLNSTALSFNTMARPTLSIDGVTILVPGHVVKYLQVILTKYRAPVNHD